MAKETQVVIKQSLLDVAIQQCGAATAAFELALLNGLSVTDALAPGLLVKSDTVTDVAVADYYRGRNFKPATMQQADLAIGLGGIGYWEIEKDFEVQ